MTPDHHPKRGTRPAVPRRLAVVARWAPVAVTFPFLILLWWTILGRLGTPWELEWNEGQSVEQAWRVVLGEPLYPAPSEGWVPYMYAPGYHLVLGWLLRLTDSEALPMGRFLSILAIAATQWAVFQFVYDRTRRALTGLLAVCLTAIWFKASGFSWDLVRVDALALAPAVWGVVLMARPGAKSHAIIGGMLLLALATFTKQTYGILAVVCTAQALLANRRATLLGGALVAFLVLNAVQLFHVNGNDAFLKYTVTNASNHLSRSDVYLPGSMWPDRFREGLPTDAGTLGFAAHYVAKWREVGAPPIWTEFIRFWWLAGGVVLLWWLASAFRGRWKTWVPLVLPFAAVMAGAVSAYAKFGGFTNNFLPFHVGLAIVLALACDGLQRAGTGWWRTFVPVGVAFVLAAQILMPWAALSPTDSRTRFIASAGERTSAMTQQMILEGARRAGDSVEEEGSLGIRLRFWVARYAHQGLIWFPSRQWPAEGSEEAFAALNRWLAERRERNEAVWIVHHHWYAIRMGHPPTMNADMVRCAEWAGDPAPGSFGDTLAAAKFQWVVLDIEDVGNEWLPHGARDKLLAAYEPMGVIPGLESARGGNALAPVTGAPMRPLYLWRSRVLGAQDKRTD